MDSALRTKTLGVILCAEDIDCKKNRRRRNVACVEVESYPRREAPGDKLHLCTRRNSVLRR